MNTAQVVKIAKALADPTRHRILERLRAQRELTCSDICGLCDQSQPTISHHVKTLVEAGIVGMRREGQYHILTLNDDVLSAFGEAVGGKPRPRRKARAKAAAR